jgi:mono/diheme cytochrome c family protein
MQNLTLSVLSAALAAASLAAAASPGAPPGPAQRGLEFSQGRCAGCHGVSEGTVSLHPEAPTFADIANRPGVTEQTLRQFLSDSHNFPEAMKFQVDPASLDDLAVYLSTLRRDDYRPAQ